MTARIWRSLVVTFSFFMCLALFSSEIGIPWMWAWWTIRRERCLPMRMAGKKVRAIRLAVRAISKAVEAL
jgi:hypothetical protein